MEFIRLNNNKKYTIKIIVCCLFICISVGCIHNILKTEQELERGTVLMEFEITDKNLLRLTKNHVKELIKAKKTDRILAFTFEEKEDTLDLSYTYFESTREICNDYLFIRHYRMIGYIEQKPYKIIVFSDIDRLYQTYKMINSMMKPTDNSLLFHDLYYQPFTISNWGEFVCEPPIRWHYKFYNGKVYGPKIGMD